MIGSSLHALETEGLKENMRESWQAVVGWAHRADLWAQKEGRSLMAYLRAELKKEGPLRPITVNLPNGS